MRGSDQRSGSLFSYVDLESRVRGDHPLRPIREIVNGALSDLSVEFEALYAAGVGRPSIPPERLLRAAASGLLRDPLRAPDHGAAGVRPFVPLVCGARGR